MTNYWVISPCDSKNEYLYESAWQYCLENRTISIGQTVKEDLSSLPRDAFRSVCDEAYRDTTKAWQTRKFNMLWQFYNDIEKGDIIYARKGFFVISGVGTVKRHAYYEYGMNKSAVGEENAYHHHLCVDWHNEPRNVPIKNLGFARGEFLKKFDTKLHLKD